jgi:hypothetical protein
MDDLKWLAITLGLGLIALIYIRLHGPTGEGNGS